eukprot:UN07415
MADLRFRIEEQCCVALNAYPQFWNRRDSSHVDCTTIKNKLPKLAEIPELEGIL